MYMPLKEIETEVEIRDSIATIKLVQVYINPTAELVEPQGHELRTKPRIVEVSYKFKIPEEVVVSNMTIQIDDKIIEAKVMEKEKAQNKYDDAIAAGNLASLARETVSKDKFIELDVGNILPGQEARIEMTLIQPLSSENGAINFQVPLSYFPQYKKDDLLDDQIKFNCKINLSSTSQKILELAYSKFFKIVE